MERPQCNQLLVLLSGYIMQACAENSDSTPNSTSIQSGIPPTCQIRGGAKPLVIFAFVIVGAEILGLSFIGSKAWGAVYFALPDPGSMQINVQAGQCAYYFRYPGAIAAMEVRYIWWSGKTGIFWDRRTTLLSAKPPTD